jgi:hypothetical protein
LEKELNYNLQKYLNQLNNEYVNCNECQNTSDNSLIFFKNEKIFSREFLAKKYLKNVQDKKRREVAYNNLKKNDGVSDEDKEIIKQDLLTTDDGVTHSVDEYREINKKAKEENVINYQKDTAFLKYKGYIK